MSWEDDYKHVGTSMEGGTQDKHVGTSMEGGTQASAEGFRDHSDA